MVFTWSGYHQGQNQETQPHKECPKIEMLKIFFRISRDNYIYIVVVHSTGGLQFSTLAVLYCKNFPITVLESLQTIFFYSGHLNWNDAFICLLLSHKKTVTPHRVVFT